MLNYETIIVFAGNLEEDAVEKKIQVYKNNIEAAKGDISEVEFWGKRLHAQTNNERRYGYYYCYKFETENAEINKDINQAISIDQEVMNAQTMRVNLPRKKYKVNRRLQGIQEDSL